MLRARRTRHETTTSDSGPGPCSQVPTRFAKRRGSNEYAMGGPAIIVPTEHGSSRAPVPAPPGRGRTEADAPRRAAGPFSRLRAHGAARRARLGRLPGLRVAREVRREAPARGARRALRRRDPDARRGLGLGARARALLPPLE